MVGCFVVHVAEGHCLVASSLPGSHVSFEFTLHKCKGFILPSLYPGEWGTTIDFV